MHVASRMSRLGTESAFEVLARARALERQGKRDHPPRDRRARLRHAGAHQGRRPSRRSTPGATHYGPSAGLPELREAIAKHIGETRGVPVSPEEVVVTPGAKPIMFFTIMALIGEGDEVIYPNPGFPIYESVDQLRRRGAGADPAARGDGLRLRHGAVRAARVAAKTKLIIINSPQNPTGGVLDRGADRAHRRRSPPSAAFPCSPTRSTASSSTTASSRRSCALPGMREHTDPARRLLQDVRDDRLAPRLRRHADADSPSTSPGSW